MKRFTDTRKFSDPWYRALSPRLKCLREWLLAECNSAGVVDIDWPLASFAIGEPVNDLDVANFGGRLDLLPSGKYFLRKFVSFQCGKLSKDCRPHAKILEEASVAGVLDRVLAEDRVYQSAHRVSAKPDTLQEKEEEKTRKEEDKTRRGSAEGDCSQQPPGTIYAQVTWLIHELGVCFYGHSLTRSAEHIEEEGALEVVKRPGWKDEVEAVRAWHNTMEAKDRPYFPQTLSALLAGWSRQLDRAHRAKQSVPPVKQFGVRGKL